MLNKLIAGAPIWKKLRDKTGRLRLYYHTLRHLKHEQITGRILRRVRGPVRLGKLPDPPEDLDGQLSSKIPFPESSSDSLTRKDITQGRFCFLNEWCDLRQPVNWQPDRPLLWQFNLHYFNYLHLLEPGEQHALCRDWVAQNPVDAQPGWHAYPTSLRIINWCKADLQAQDVLSSLYQQAAYLHRNVETHILGNHVLENARALIFAGHFFNGQGEANTWIEHGLSLYREQTPEQVLPDGGHFERSPMYHAIVLEGYVDVLNLLPDDHVDRPWLCKAVERMSDFMVSLTYPDGTIPLFNDSTQEIALPADRLLTYVSAVTGYKPEPHRVLAETGYYIGASDDIYLAIDGGPVGPDYLPAHAHADIFSYVLAIHGHPFITDTGVYEYEAGSMRDYVRSTQAHNTVCVDGADQVECWSSFRVARRTSPRDVSFEKTDAIAHFEGTFDGYSDLLGETVVHHRSIHLDGLKRSIRITDTIRGSGTHVVESRVHLHPDVQVERHPEGCQLVRGGIAAEIRTDQTAIDLEKGEYCPEFGKQIERGVLVMRKESRLPVRFSYVITW